ncbi:MAG TPA: hypothetical protein VHV77_07640 [Pirellulales bacterium]|jgi:fucose permease|nr:hypothetical protein [Pirellulales bacterium]
MLIPRFSVRFMLLLTAMSAVLFLVMSWAIAGVGWAVGATMAVVMLTVIAAVHAGLFAIVWLFALVTRGGRRKAED